MRYGKIYKATNKITGKNYIGQTLSDLEQRKKNHMKSANNPKVKDLFHKVLKEEGLEGFEWKIIDHKKDLLKLFPDITFPIRNK